MLDELYFPHRMSTFSHSLFPSSPAVKGYVRKGKILQGLKQYSNAQAAYQKAIDIDPNCQDALDGFRECMMAVNSDPEEVRRRKEEEGWKSIMRERKRMDKRE